VHYLMILSSSPSSPLRIYVPYLCALESRILDQFLLSFSLDNSVGDMRSAEVSCRGRWSHTLRHTTRTNSDGSSLDEGKVVQDHPPLLLEHVLVTSLAQLSSHLNIPSGLICFHYVFSIYNRNSCGAINLTMRSSPTELAGEMSDARNDGRRNTF
jgi:hypothetical protein